MNDDSKSIWDELGECDPDMNIEEFREMVESIEVDEDAEPTNTHCPACGKELDDASWFEAGIWISDGTQHDQMEFYPDPGGLIYCTDECAMEKSRCIMVSEYGAMRTETLLVRCTLCERFCDPEKATFSEGSYTCPKCSEVSN